MKTYKVFIKVLRPFLDRELSPRRFIRGKILEIKTTKSKLASLVRFKKVEILGIKQPSNGKKKVTFYLPTVYNTGVYQKLYNLIGHIKDHYDITVVYDNITSLDKFIELSSLVTVKKIVTNIDSDTSVFLSLVGNSDNKLKSKKYIQDINCCVLEEEDPSVKFRPNCDTYIAVSKEAAKQYQQMFGVKPKVIENPLNPLIDLLSTEPVDIPNDKLVLVTASRLTELKGIYRMQQFAQELYDNGVDFIWYILGELKPNLPEIKNGIYLGYKSNPFPYIKRASYLVQLSTYESDCLAIREALYLETPVIVTNWKGVKEKVKEGKNGYILNMSLNNIDINKIKTPPKIKKLNNEGHIKWLEEL